MIALDYLPSMSKELHAVINSKRTISRLRQLCFDNNGSTDFQIAALTSSIVPPGIQHAHAPGFGGGHGESLKEVL